MTTRVRLVRISLWLAVLGLSVWIGGTIYQMVVIVPMWSHSPPESVRTFFTITRYNETIWNFFGPPFMIARLLPLLAALALGWYLPRHRYWLLAAVASMAFGIVFTLIYVYPINEVLFFQAGGRQSDEGVTILVDNWIFADRLRFVVGLAGFLCLLRAFSLPISNRNSRDAAQRRTAS